MKRKRQLLLAILISIIIIGIAAFSICNFCSTDDEYIIKTENHFEMQSALECSGYSLAYTLRSLGVDANGMDLYTKIKTKNADGTVDAGNLAAYIEEIGYESELCTGTLEELEDEVSEGTPVITLVRVSGDSEYFHYDAVVGYDKDNIYVAESLPYKVNAEEKYYNRKIGKEEFMKMWDTGLPYSNLYITVALHDK